MTTQSQTPTDDPETFLQRRARQDEAWKARCAEFQTQAQAIAQALAAQTGEPWNIDRPNPSEEIAYPQQDASAMRADGVTLYIGGGARFSADPPNYTISAGLKFNRQYRSLRMSNPNGISISKQKTPDQIARDIVRRLLPEADERAAIVLSEIHAEKKAEAWKNKAAACLRDEWAGARIGRNADAVHFPNDPNGAHGDAGFAPYSERVSLSLESLTLEVAARILRLAQNR